MPDRPVALVTGAAGGIGCALVAFLAERGWDLSLTDMRTSGLAEATVAAERHGAAILSASGDLADAVFLGEIVPATLRRFARLDLLVNNAAFGDHGGWAKLDRGNWDRTLAVNLTAPAFLASAAAEAMEARGRGVIINVSSIEAKQSKGLSPAYIAAKGGLEALTRNLAVRYGPAGVRALCVRLGAIDTRLGTGYRAADGSEGDQGLRQAISQRTPLGRWGRPQEVARTIACLAGDDASFMTGAVIDLDGGLSISLVPYGMIDLEPPGGT